MGSRESQGRANQFQSFLFEAATGIPDRLMLRDGQWESPWERMSALIVGDARTRGSLARDNRMFVEAGGQPNAPHSECLSFTSRAPRQSLVA